MQLRDYQLKAKQDIYNAWNNGAKNVLIQLCTGAGKTILFCDIIAELKLPTIVIAHRMELVSQISLTLARYGIRHNLIAQKQVIRNIIAIHMLELKQNFYNPQSKIIVAGVDTLIKQQHPWYKEIKLGVQDEGHHPLKKNKWGKAATLFPNARWLYPTATPKRADGCGLGIRADGLIHELILGPPMRQLIERGHLTDYKIIAPPTDIDLTNVPVSSTGDYNLFKLRKAVHKSHITGDVVQHYLKFAKGKLGVTFAVDIASAIEIATEFKIQGVPAEVISGKTPDLLRAQLIQKFKNKEILQLVNVDLLGEGVDIPGIEVVSMARPTHSLIVYFQQFGRALRPAPGKTHAIIIDHVNNWVRHGLPDKPRLWSLERAERKSKNSTHNILTKVCLNPECLSIYERIKRTCPYCGHYTPPAQRSLPEHVDGDLIELDQAILAKLRGEIQRIDSVAHPPQHLDGIAQRAVIKNHLERQRHQATLRESIALWAGHEKTKNKEDSEIYRLFYFTFGIDILTAQTLNVKDANTLETKIREYLT